MRDMTFCLLLLIVTKDGVPVRVLCTSFKVGFLVVTVNLK